MWSILLLNLITGTLTNPGVPVKTRSSVQCASFLLMGGILMYNKPKNSLEYSEPVIEQYSDNVVLEVIPKKIDDDTSSKYVLIKHDYYSSDSDHGREMLKSIFNALSHS